MDEVFKALADPLRRELLDRLRSQPGLTLTELEEPYPLTRFGVMRHLRILEEAGLVTSERAGRHKHHFLNPVPLMRVHERWLDRFTSNAAAALLALKQELEEPMTTESSDAPRTDLNQIFEIYIRTTPERLWKALTEGEMTRQYYYKSVVASTWEAGARCEYHIDGDLALTGEILEIEPQRRLVTTFDARWSDAVAADAPTRITWDIEPQGELCRLRVLHEGFPGETATYESVRGGMSWILSGLKTLLETGVPLAA